jgi:F0F1-type ATP synthase delta subunit
MVDLRHKEVFIETVNHFCTQTSMPKQTIENFLSCVFADGYITAAEDILEKIKE